MLTAQDQMRLAGGEQVVLSNGGGVKGSVARAYDWPEFPTRPQVEKSGR